jgi:hypothetical protein
MLSVIVPTMWRSPYVVDLLTQLNEVDSIGEVILIDNDHTKSVDLSHLEKVVHVKNPANNYVSPSWNQGYYLSKHENLCFLNDDIIIPKNLFELVDSFLGPNIGMVGLLSDVYENILPGKENLGRAEGVRLTLCTNRNFGYGCCIFMHRSNYKMIPEELKIQYGDDFLFYSCPKNSFVLDGFQIVGKLSGTLYDDNLQLINKEEVSAICTSDHNFFWEVCAKEILKRDPVDDLDSLKLEALARYEQQSKGNYYF